MLSNNKEAWLYQVVASSRMGRIVHVHPFLHSVFCAAALIKETHLKVIVFVFKTIRDILNLRRA